MSLFDIQVYLTYKESDKELKEYAAVKIRLDEHF